MSKLKPCPFCQSDQAVVVRDRKPPDHSEEWDGHFDCYWVLCRDCSMQGPHKHNEKHFTTKEAAESYWNALPRREETAPMIDLLERIVGFWHLGGKWVDIDERISPLALKADVLVKRHREEER